MPCRRTAFFSKATFAIAILLKTIPIFRPLHIFLVESEYTMCSFIVFFCIVQNEFEFVLLFTNKQIEFKLLLLRVFSVCKYLTKNCLAFILAYDCIIVCY